MRTFLVFCVLLPALLYGASVLVAKFLDLILPGYADSAPLGLLANRGVPFITRKYERATELYKLGNLEDASRLWEEVLTEYEMSGNDLGIASTGLMVGYCQERLGKNREAIQYYTKATSIPPPQDRHSWILALRHLGSCQVAVEDHSSAIETFKRLSQVYKDNCERHESVAALVTLANVLTYKGRVGEASDWFNNALALSKELGSVEGRYAALYSYSLLLDLEGCTREAIGCLREAAELSRGVKDGRAPAEVYLTLSYFLRSVGEIQEADEISRKAMEMARESGNVPLLIHAQHSRAILEWAKGNRQKTFELLDRAEELIQSQQENANDLRVRRVLLWLTRAWYKEETDQFDDALAFLDKAEPLSTDLPLHLRAELYRSRTLALAKSGRWEEARSVLASGGPFATARSIPYCNAQYEYAAGVTAGAAKEYPDSLAALKRAVEFFEKAEQKRDTALACKQLVMISRALSDNLQAEQYRKRAIDIFLAAGDTKSAGEVGESLNPES